MPPKECGWVLVTLDSDYTHMAADVAEEIKKKGPGGTGRWCAVRVDEIHDNADCHIVVPAVWQGSTKNSVTRDIKGIEFEVGGSKVNPVADVKVLQVDKHNPKTEYKCPADSADREGGIRPDNPWG